MLKKCFRPSEEDADGRRSPTGTKSLGVLGLASLVFFSVAGSPAGSEDSVAAGGALWAIVGFLVLPLVWSVPEALITAELSTTFPHNGGFVMWVSEAFGDTAGYIEGLLKWSSGVLDGAVYPVMMLNYLRKVVPGLRSELVGRIFVVVVTLILTWAQYLGLEIVGVTSNVVILTTMLPFVVLVVWGFPKMEWDQVVEGRPLDQIDWALFLTNLFWNLNYWDSVSTLASEVKNPARTYPRALAVAMVLTVLMYVLVIAVAAGNAPPNEAWDNAELADAGVWVAGAWLRIWIVVSVSISTVGLFLAELSTDIYQLEGMASMGMLPKLFAVKNAHKVPVVALVFEVVLILFIDQVAASVEDIIAYEMVGYCAAMVLEFFAFVRLRMTHADIPRPFKTPGGLYASIALVVPATLFTVAIMVMSPWNVWVAGGAQAVFAVGVALLCKYFRRTHPEYFILSPQTSRVIRLMPGRRLPDEVHESLLAQEKEAEDGQRDLFNPATSPSVLNFQDGEPARSHYIEVGAFNDDDSHENAKSTVVTAAARGPIPIPAGPSEGSDDPEANAAG
mmetsp:Transcript_20462/g.53230  ORF Transcript_20462/g.53230 Transcript_20462/m.53230 type:complete len:561 (+) Transcript_20462:302-1984(+)